MEKVGSIVVSEPVLRHVNHQLLGKFKVFIPKFIQKLTKILSSPQNERVIRWNEAGTVVFITNGKYFINEVASKYFKNPTLVSFLRQLNAHGFTRKKTGSRYRNKGNLPSCSDVEIEFSHPLFIRGKEELYHMISRFSNANQSNAFINSLPSLHHSSNITTDVCTEVKTMDAPQLSIDPLNTQIITTESPADDIIESLNNFSLPNSFWHSLDFINSPLMHQNNLNISWSLNTSFLEEF